MNKLKEYLEEFNKEYREKFIFGLVIYNDSAKDKITQELNTLSNVSVLGNCVENDTDIIEKIKSGKITVIDTKGSISSELYKFLLSVFHNDPDLHDSESKIKESSVIFLVEAKDYNKFESGDLEFYTCNLSSIY